MRPKISVFIATSLDGFIAKEDGSIDWLNDFNQTVPSGEDCGYSHFIKTVDTLIMGRKTFEQVLTFTPWPYENLPVVVLSQKQQITIPEQLIGKVSTTSESPQSLVTRLYANGVKHVYLDGGKTIQSFLQANLVDELTVTVIPILLGSGLSLFGPLKKDIPLKQVDCIAYDFGCVQLKYQIG